MILHLQQHAPQRLLHLTISLDRTLPAGEVHCAHYIVDVFDEPPLRELQQFEVDGLCNTCIRATYVNMDLQTRHSSLNMRLRELEVDRPAPWLLIEHGCTNEEIQAMTQQVSQELQVHDIGEAYWRSAYLPLLIIATEVGYDFGEERTEYWPRLGQRLSFDFVESDWRCAALRDLFQSASPVRAPSIDWARHFNRIAYPVTHALLPRWLHEPLLSLLLDCPYQVQPGGHYFAWMLGMVERYPKLAMLLHPDRQKLAQDVIEGILEVKEPQFVTPSVIKRFREDVYRTPSTRAKLKEARARQPLLRPAPLAPAAPPSRSARQGSAALLIPLTLSPGSRTLAISPVAPNSQPPAGADSIRVYPLTERRPTSLSAFLREGAPLTRPLPDTEDETTPIFDERTANLPTPVRLHMSALRAHLRPPLLFTDRQGSGGVAVQVLNGAFSPSSEWWVLVKDEPPPIEGIELIGPVGRLTCVRVDTTSTDGEEWLIELGFKRIVTPALRIVGASPLDGPAGRLYAPMDIVGLSVKSGPVLCDHASLSDGLYLLPGEGERHFENPAGAPPVSLKITRATLPPRTPDVRIELAGALPSADALRARRLGLRVSGHAALAGLRARLTIEADGKLIAEATTTQLPTLPCVLPPEDPVWEVLADSVPMNRPIALRAEIGGIGRARWWLPPIAAEVSWYNQIALGERPIIGYRHFNAETPLVETNQPSSFYLKLPKYADGSDALCSGLCVAPRRMTLEHIAPTPPAQVTRDWKGIQPLLTSLQAWSTARTEHLIAEVVRQRTTRALDLWTERALCGESWSAKIEKLQPYSSIGVVITNRLRRPEIALDELAEEEWEPAQREALFRVISRMLDGSEAFLRSMMDGDVDPEELASMINKAYRTLGVDSDVSCEPEATTAAIKSGFEEHDRQSELHLLLERILPQSKRADLATLPYVDATDEQLVEELTKWLRSASLVAPWPIEQVRALLGVWLWPARVELEEALFERALADQMGARAVRYATLRRRGAIR